MLSARLGGSMTTTTSKSKDYVLHLDGIDDERKLVAPMCKMHFTKQPMKICRARKQYVFDDADVEYLDCSGNIAHVGHCHPRVVFSGQKQLEALAVSQGFMTDVQTEYAKALLTTVSDSNFDTVLFVNSGSEALDLAIRLAQHYTKRKDILNHQPALHGHLGSLSQMHYKYIRRHDFKREQWVHHTPICNAYRGPFSQSTDPVKEALCRLRKDLDDLAKSKTPVAALVTEAIHSAAGVVVPPKGYLPAAYKLVRESGGLIIGDEVLTGMGRYGTHMWSYQHFNATPDILVCGRCMGNGQPVACVITSHNISNALPLYSNSYGGNPVSCAMGLAVLDVMRDEHMLNSAASVGKVLVAELDKLKSKHVNIGDVRGMGLSLALEIVEDKETRKPAADKAEKISYCLRDKHRILVPVDGPDANCLFITPPMCFSQENAHTLIKALDLVLTSLEEDRIESIQTLDELKLAYQIPINIFESSMKRKPGHPAATGAGSDKKAKIDDID